MAIHNMEDALSFLNCFVHSDDFKRARVKFEFVGKNTSMIFTMEEDKHHVKTMKISKSTRKLKRA